MSPALRFVLGLFQNKGSTGGSKYPLVCYLSSVVRPFRWFERTMKGRAVNAPHRVAAQSVCSKIEAVGLSEHVSEAAFKRINQTAASPKLTAFQTRKQFDVYRHQANERSRKTSGRVVRKRTLRSIMARSSFERAVVLSVCCYMVTRFALEAGLLAVRSGSKTVFDTVTHLEIDITCFGQYAVGAKKSAVCRFCSVRSQEQWLDWLLLGGKKSEPFLNFL